MHTRFRISLVISSCWCLFQSQLLNMQLSCGMTYCRDDMHFLCRTSAQYLTYMWFKWPDCSTPLPRKKEAGLGTRTRLSTYLVWSTYYALDNSLVILTLRSPVTRFVITCTWPQVFNLRVTYLERSNYAAQSLVDETIYAAHMYGHFLFIY